MLDFKRRVVGVFAAGFLMLAAVFGLIGEASTSTTGLFHDSTQSVLADVRSPVHICRQCGAPHGGVYHPHYCHNCVSKGLTPVKP